MSEILRRIDNAISNYSSSQMNNVKWREVLSAIGEIDILIQFAFVRDEEFKQQIHFPEGGCNLESTKDCTGHGPFYFKEIFAIKCPIYEIKTNLKTGAKIKDTKKSDRLLSELKQIGKLPISKEGDFILLNAYV